MRRRAFPGIAAAVLAASLLGAFLWGLGKNPSAVEGADDAGSIDGEGPSGAGGAPAPAAAAAAALDGGTAQLPGEEVVRLESAVVVGPIERDRPWVCAGQSMGLSATLSGERPVGLVQRWVWESAEGGSELHPGPTVAWRAPATPGTYAVHFQACRDLGGRRVGVLAERRTEIEVRGCEGGASADSLRIAVAQRHRGSYAFHVEPIEGVAFRELRWDLGDGQHQSTSGTDLVHAYALDELSPHESRAFVVRVEAEVAGDEPLTASTIVLVRGPAPPGVRPPARARLERWRRRPDGSGWESPVVVRAETDESITWDHLERIIKTFDDRVEVRELPWDEAVTIDEALEQGGFRGRVIVDDDEVPPEVKQIIDQLHGQTESGQPVSLSWTPFERRAPEDASQPVPAPRPR